MPIDPAFDILVFLFLVGGLFLFAAHSGMMRVIAIFYATVISTLLAQVLPESVFLNDGMKTALFFVILVALSYVFIKVKFFKTQKTMWWDALFISVLTAGFFSSSVLSLTVVSNTIVLSPLSTALFMHPWSLISWLAAAVIGGMMVTRKT